MPPQIDGPYAGRLSPADVEEIRLLAAAMFAGSSVHTNGPPSRLTVYAPDHVGVEVPISDPYADKIAFNVVKRRGHWVDPSPNERVIVTGANKT